jgi:acyl-CoA dehydrogenase
MTTTAPAPPPTTVPSAPVPGRPEATFRPSRPGDDAFVDLARRIGAVAAEHATEHDRDATFVHEAYEAMRRTGYLGLVVPVELGGQGATMRQASFAQAELARHDAATALASTMHVYNSLVQVFRWRSGAPGAEGVLRRIVDDDLVIATSGGSDWLWVDTVARPTEGGFLVSGTKHFCSQAPEATVVSTSAVVGEPAPGAEVLHFSLPLSTPGLRLEPTWDTLGMRGTASHSLVLEDVFVPESSVIGRRPWGELGGPLKAAGLHFAPVGAATYLGIAAASRDLAVAGAVTASRGEARVADLARAHRQVGEMDGLLRGAWWAVLGAVDEITDEAGVVDVVDAERLATAMLAKRQAVLAATDVVDLAMDVLGGRSYFRSSPLERRWRDVRAGTFHPFTPEVTLAYAGRLALGIDTDTE